MAALLSSSRRRRKDRSCHFCGASKPSECDCGGWTRKDENGNLIDYLPQMSDPSLNPKPHQAFSIPRILTVSRSPTTPKGSSNDRGNPSSSDSPFCSTCLANQNLQLNLLANYLPGDLDHPQSRSRADSPTRTLMDNLPAYKASLEARYPILCSSCSEKASELIKERNYKVKAFSLNESVKRLAKPFKSTFMNSNHAHSASSNNNPSLTLSGMGGKLWRLQEWVWRLHGVAWLSSYLVSSSVAIYSSFTFECKPILISPALSTRASLLGLPMNSISYCFLELGCSCFDFTWARVRKNRAQGIRTKVIGKRWFLCLNVIGCLLRLSFWFYSFDAEIQAGVNAYICEVSNSFGSLIYGMFGALQLALLAASLIILKTDSPIGVKSLATSQTRSLAQSTPKPTAGLAEHELFSTLSLARPPPSSSLNQAAHLNSPTTVGGGPRNSRLQGEPAFGKLSSLQGPFNEPVGQPWNPSAPPPPDDETSGGSKEVSMDWEPMNPHRDSQPNDILLRPQTFIPPPPFREETGIEELFQDKAKLIEADDVDHDQKPSGWLKQLFSVKPPFKQESSSRLL
ncbi:hypothetical protein PGTUg99_031859 [Puccinia graminis f. sp. tritici]|uniref:Ima1 N-terminal domain-containing protein n=1 Tax=Puccinia graminis f. sp. tritici TaxID=56615 RepID=A0A5B0SMU2_PUCGR|nr:hypothetical protein PGTUg99_031859 [Puccinia graminis f. sp. tritici]